MPPHPEVRAALQKLREAGFRLFTLTDNLPEVQTRQLEHAGIVGFFDRRFSADGVKRHKPSRETYAQVERSLGVKPSQLWLIACHTWDTLGAVAAGWEAALIKRQRPLGSRPAAADRRCRLGRRRRSVDRATPQVSPCRVTELVLFCARSLGGRIELGESHRAAGCRRRQGAGGAVAPDFVC